MKIKHSLAAIFTSLFFSNVSLAVDVAVGKVTYLQVSGDHEAFYFRLNSMPSGVHHFYSDSRSSGTQAGCNLRGSDTILQRQYSAVLAAYASGAELKIQYCKTTTGYGLTATNSGYIGLQ